MSEAQRMCEGGKMIGDLEDNWYMGPQPIDIPTLEELRERTSMLTGLFKITDGRGNRLTIRIGDRELIIEPYNDANEPRR